MNTKRILSIFFLILSTLATRAQIAKWVIHPELDSLWMDTENALIIGAKEGETSFWTEEGSLLSSTKDKLCSFKQGKAVTLKPNTGVVTGFFSVNGDYISIDPCNVAWGYPYFSDGFLLVKPDDFFQFIDSDGRKSTDKYYIAFPYNAGLAACYTFEDLEKKKNPMWFYITTKEEKIQFILNGKDVDAEDINFLSSLTDEGYGILATKHKFYYYNHSTGNISPLYEKEGETDKKKQASLDGDLLENLKEGDGVYVITAKVGKLGKAELYLDKNYIPLKIDFTEKGTLTSSKIFKRNKYKIPSYTTQLSKEKSEENGKWMLAYRGKDIVTHIFDSVRILKDDLAFVHINDKWGMIDVSKDESFAFKINDGERVGFRHRNFKTSIRLNLPSYIPFKKTSFEIAEKEKFHIDGTSVNGRDTENGNYVEYDCAIDIPDSLQDTETEIECNAQISYDGLVTPLIPITFRAWHVKRFNVDYTDEKLNNDEFSFTLNIDEQKNIGDTDYLFEVAIKPDSIIANVEKLSETRYKITLPSLVEGTTEFSVNILEDGCPPQKFPFEVTYTKPVAKSRNKKAESAKAIMRKKQVTKSVQKAVTTPKVLM